MALYDRLMGVDNAGQPVENKIHIHQFIGLMGEFARGVITGTQAQNAVTLISGAPLDAAEVIEVQALMATVTGSATVKLARVKLIEDVLVLSENRAIYTTPAAVKTRLGV